MNAPISRRKLAGMALTLPLAAAIGHRAAVAQTPVMTDASGHAILADTRNVFDAEYGKAY